MNASLAIQILPKVTGDAEVCRIVDEVIAYIQSTGLHTFVGPCETAVEGDFDTIMEIAKQCHLIAIQAGGSRCQLLHQDLLSSRRRGPHH